MEKTVNKEPEDSNKMKLIQFKASWCGPCKQQTKEFEENPLDIELETVDIDEDKEGLVEKFGIGSIPTMVLLENGDIIHEWIGITKSSTINGFIKEYTHKV